MFQSFLLKKHPSGIRTLLVFLLFSFFIFSCSKNDSSSIPENSMLEEYIGLESDVDSIYSFDTCKVSAIAKGVNLVYEWSTSSNAPLIPIEGISSEIYFYADPCVQPGQKIVYCTIKASNKTETKKDTITIISKQ